MTAVAAIRHNPWYQELGPAPAQNTPNIDITRKTLATPCAISYTLTVLQNTEYFLGGSSSISAHYLPPVNIENIDIPYLLACVEIHQLIDVLKNIVDTASSLQWTVVIFALIWAVTDGGAEAAACRDLITFSFHSCRPQHHSNHSHCMCPLCPLFAATRGFFALLKYTTQSGPCRCRCVQQQAPATNFGGLCSYLVSINLWHVVVAEIEAIFLRFILHLLPSH